MKLRTLLLILPACILLPAATMAKEGGKMADMKLTSSAFTHKGEIPGRYSCDGRDLSPPLSITNVPEGAKSLALIVDDPDAPVGTWVHWVVWNISPHTAEIGENSLPPGVVQGVNGWQRNRYGGPCPPSGTHRYFFRLYALDTLLNLAPTAGREPLLRAMEGHIISRAELMGTYRRK